MNYRMPTEPKAFGVKTPLLGKILAWLLLNLLLLGAVFLFLFQGQFRLEALMAGPAGDRVNAVAQTIVSALHTSPPEEWNDLLRDFGQPYKVQFALLGPEGEHIAGSPEDLPQPLAERVEGRRGPEGPGPQPPGNGPPIGKGRRRPWGQLGPMLHVQPVFTLKTDDPKRYWVGLRIPPVNAPLEGPPRPTAWTLLLSTDSLYGGGLFFDAKLWVVTAAGAVLLSVLLWIPLVRGLTGSIRRLTRATDEIAGGNFAVRLPQDRNDELGQLGRSVNRMADRLDGYVKGQKRFLGDIAHELCSPIARMQVGLGILENSALPRQEEAMNDLRAELEEMSGLINELLSFSKAGLAGPAIALESVGLAAVAGEVVRREGGGKSQVLVREGTHVMARPELLRRALANLVRNAVRYAGAAGPVTILDADQGDEVLVIVRDMGTGVPQAELQRIFDPFYRAEQSRSRDTGGAGLGLAIVKTCAEACSGSVSASNLEPQGFQITIRLKRAR